MRQKGEVLGNRFELIEYIGHGGMSEVYRARDRLLEREVALKIIYPHLAAEEVVRRRFRNEVEINRTLRHPGAVAVYEYFEFPESDLAFLAMEYLPGGDLKSRLQTSGPLSIPGVIGIGITLLEVLGEAHSRGIIHRDIKPHNLLFDRDGVCRLGDFGLARSAALEGLSGITALAGTPEYCAPEMVEGMMIDGRGDLYSLGVTLFEAVTGVLPFLSNSPYETLRLQLEKKPPDPAALRGDIPPELSAFILKLLAKNPADRYQSAGEALEALRSRRIDVTEGHLLHEEPVLCPECGEKVSPTFPFCFKCNRSLLRLEKVEKGAPVFGITVIGPGKAGEKIPQEKRYKCIEIMSHSPVNLNRLKKSIPRLPFRLIDGISYSGGEELVRRLADAGLEAILTGPGLERNTKISRSSIVKKILTMYPRVLMIIAGTTAGVWAQIIRFWGIGLVLIIGLLVGLPVGLSIAYGSALLRWKKEEGFQAIEYFLTLPGKLTRREHRLLASRLSEKFFFLEKRLPVISELSEAEKNELQKGVAALAKRGCELFLLLRDPAGGLERENEQRLYKEIEELEEQIDGGLKETELLIRKKELALMALETLRKRERAKDSLLDALLRLSSKLDNLILDMASLKRVQAGMLLKNLKEAGEILEPEVQGLEELFGSAEEKELE